MTSVSQSDGFRTCYKCNTAATQRCSSCHVTWYCGKVSAVNDMPLGTSYSKADTYFSHVGLPGKRLVKRWSQEGMQIAGPSRDADEAGLEELPRILQLSTSKRVDPRVTVRPLK
jgi:hypothetical protein